jgi:CheY-like chemotaxis protein
LSASRINAHPDIDRGEPEKSAMASKVPVYIVEDDEDDLVLLRYCLQHSAVDFPFEFRGNGETFLSFLQKADLEAGKDSGKSPGFILLLDLKMPKVDGFDVLAWVKSHPKFQHNPVVVLSSSNMSEDVEKAYALGASWYLQKPCTLNEYHKLVRRFAEFCQRICDSDESDERERHSRTPPDYRGLGGY